MIELFELKEHLRLPPDHDSEDAYIVGLELAAVQAIQNETRRFFGPTEEVTEEIYSGAGDDVIWLTEIPGTTPDTITVETWNGTEWEETDAADYEIDGFALYHKTAIWDNGRRNIRVTYERGYAPGEEPWPIRQAVLLLVGHWYQNRENVVVGTIVQELPQGVRALVAPYRRLRV